MKITIVVEHEGSDTSLVHEADSFQDAITALSGFAGHSPTDILKPNAGLLIAIASLVVHYEELNSSGGHPADKVAIDSIRNQPDVKEWFEQMSKMAFLPIKRGE